MTDSWAEIGKQISAETQGAETRRTKTITEGIDYDPDKCPGDEPAEPANESDGNVAES